MRLIKVNGYNFALDANNRFRKNWKNEYKKERWIYGKCALCGKEGKMTADHQPPLRFEAHTKTRHICRVCHSELNRREAEAEAGKCPSFIKSCGKRGHNTFLRADLSIHCPKCEKVINNLILTGEGEYEQGEMKWRKWRER